MTSIAHLKNKVVPYYETTLPVSGKKVKFRPFTMAEEEILLMATESDEGNAIINSCIQIIESCIDMDTTPIDTKSLSITDVEWMFLQLRIRSKGETEDITFVCQGEDCSFPHERTIDFTKDVVVKKGDVNPLVKITDEISVEVRPPSFNSLGKEQEIDILTTCIKSIVNGDDVFYADEIEEGELKEFLLSLSIGQFEAIGEAIGAMPKITIPVKWKCQSCEHDNHVTLEGLNDFFG